MEMLKFNYEKTSLVTSGELHKSSKKLQTEIERIENALLNKSYDSPYASLHLCNDDELRKHVLHVAEEKKKLNPSTLVVVGIGGSNLGTIAVHEAVYGKFYNEQNPDIKLYFADTVDSDHIYDIVLLVEQELEKENNVIINVVSKSGTTTETIANFELFFYLLKKYYKDTVNEYIVVTTDKDSPLWKLGKQKKFVCLEIPKQVGGRYSVFSAVGLFPLALLGIDIKGLHAGAKSILPYAINTDIFQNSAALSAAIRAIHYQKGININDMFLFSVDLESIGKWYRQLMGESIGKQVNTKGEEVFVGITSTVSVGSIDLHSVAQLYLGGPRDKLTNFISVEKNKSNIVLSQLHEFDTLVPNIQGKSFATIMEAIMHGTQTAYAKHKRPFMTITLPNKSVHTIGQLLQLKMIEIMYLGYLLDVNPFDQPQVELYKKETKTLLAKK